MKTIDFLEYVNTLTNDAINNDKVLLEAADIVLAIAGCNPKDVPPNSPALKLLGTATRLKLQLEAVKYLLSKYPQKILLQEEGDKTPSGPLN